MFSMMISTRRLLARPSGVALLATGCREPWPRADRDIDAAGGQRLLDAGIAGEAQDLQVDAFLLVDLGLDADLCRPEGEGIGHRLAEPDLVEGQGRDFAFGLLRR